MRFQFFLENLLELIVLYESELDKNLQLELLKKIKFMIKKSPFSNEVSFFPTYISAWESGLVIRNLKNKNLTIFFFNFNLGCDLIFIDSKFNGLFFQSKFSCNKLTILNCQISNLKILNASFRDTVLMESRSGKDLSNSKTVIENFDCNIFSVKKFILEEVIFSSTFHIYSSFDSNLFFRGIDFSTTKKVIFERFSPLSVEFEDVDFPNVILPSSENYSSNKQRLLYSKLKNYMLQQGNFILASKFRYLEKISYYEYLSWKKDFGKKLLTFFSKYFSDFQENFSKTIFYYWLLSSLLFIFLISTLHMPSENLIGQYFYFLIPFKFIELPESSLSPIYYIIIFIHYLFSLVLLHELFESYKFFSKNF